MNIGSITIAMELQPRTNGLETEHVRALQECPGTWPPLSVVQVNGKMVLVDGFHRLAAAQNLGLAEVPVQVLPVPEDGDLYALAFSLNATHGRPLSLNDRRAYANQLLLDHPEWSDREIGRRTGLSSNTVGKIRQHLEGSAQIEPPRTRVGAGGYEYTVDTPAKRDSGSSTQSGSADAQEWSADDRRHQRDIVEFLRQLAGLLVQSDRLTAWETPDDAAFACQAVLGKDKSDELADTLGLYSLMVFNVALELGWEQPLDQGGEQS